jgi:hypothetical protein
MSPVLVLQGDLNYQDSLEMNPHTDLENPMGAKAIGVMPQRLGITDSTHDFNFGVFALNEFDIVQGPANASVWTESMTGKKQAGDVDVHNYNSYRVPVNTSINVDLFQKMADGHNFLIIALRVPP